MNEQMQQEVKAEGARVRALLVEIIASKPEGYIYHPPEVVPRTVTPDTCVYLTYEYVPDGGEGITTDHRNRPLRATGASCLVGHLLLAEDVSKADLCEAEGAGVSRVATIHSPEVRYALDCLQSSQDQGDTWQHALELYDESFADALRFGMTSSGGVNFGGL